MISAINAIIRWISLRVITFGCRSIMGVKTRTVVEGLAQVPPSGPVLIVARHYHHFYDGCVFLGVFPRRLHIFVALDWIQHQWTRRLMEWACSLAEWPMILRSEILRKALQRNKGSAYTYKETRSYLLRATNTSVRVLRKGESLLIFPEAYPTIDPFFTPRQGNNAFLPFRTGFVRLVEMAERDQHTQVPIIPAGLSYVYQDGWQITIRFGTPRYRRDYQDARQLAQDIEYAVRVLSLQPSPHNPSLLPEMDTSHI